MTQKPSNFTMNSDYLSIAQVDSNTYDVYVGGGTLVQGGFSLQNFDFTTTPHTGAIDRILMSKDGGNYRLSAYMAIYPTWDPNWNNNVAGSVRVYRTSTTNLRVQVVLENFGSGTSTYPSMTFKIKVCRFNAPNVF